ncbi:hypothetical protein GCM10007148_14670 [Parvularcula lutaonensis]|nr:hypothetical protein GCM10007148_14670 [Parvularcula lutaonensis]
MRRCRAQRSTDSDVSFDPEDSVAREELRAPRFGYQLTDQYTPAACAVLAPE